MWCICTGGGKHGFTRISNSNLWGCAECLKPTRLVFEKVTDMYAPATAIALLSVHVREDGIHEVKWATPAGEKVTLSYHPYPRKVDMNQGRGLLLSLWQRLDIAFAGLKDAPGDPEIALAKLQCRTLAEVLAEFMQPFFTSADDIAREAQRRYQAQQTGTEYETPGLAEKIWDPNSRWDGTVFSDESLTKVDAGQRPKAAAVSKRTGNKIPNDSINASTQAIQLGMFTVAQIAKTYSMSEAEVKEQLGLA